MTRIRLDRINSRKTLTEDQKEVLRSQWKKANEKKQAKKLAKRKELIVADLEKPIRNCTSCGPKPKDEFGLFESKRFHHRLVYRTKCKSCLASAKRNKEQTVRGRFSNYKTDAKKRDFIFDLTIEEFEVLLSGSCAYCGKETAGGVDRVDSSTGYFTDNCVPCCRRCNVIKMNHSVADMYAHIEKMLEHHKGIVCH